MPYHLSITLGWVEISAREYYSKLTVNVSIFRYQYQEYVR